jgi:hypothetical protein
MKDDNCINCLYSEYTEVNIFINNLTDSNNMTCTHKNSPYYEENVNVNDYCRLFLDAHKYFLQQDRKEKLENIKKINGK